MIVYSPVCAPGRSAGVGAAARRGGRASPAPASRGHCAGGSEWGGAARARAVGWTAPSPTRLTRPSDRLLLGDPGVESVLVDRNISIKNWKVGCMLN